MDKIESFDPHPCVLRWVVSFLQGRQQRVKIVKTINNECSINGAVPQGAPIGKETFELMISDLTSLVDIRKYVDYTKLYEILKMQQQNNIQAALDSAVDWTTVNDMNIKQSKQNKMTLSLMRNKEHKPLTIPNESVKCAKVVGVYIQSDFKWNAHVDFMIKRHIRGYRFCHSSGEPVHRPRT